MTWDNDERLSDAEKWHREMVRVEVEKAIWPVLPPEDPEEYGRRVADEIFDKYVQNSKHDKNREGR